MANDEERIRRKLAHTFRATPGDFTTVTLSYKGDELAKVDSKSKPPKKGDS